MVQAESQRIFLSNAFRQASLAGSTATLTAADGPPALFAPAALVRRPLKTIGLSGP
jgi:hypothetical protein